MVCVRPLPPRGASREGLPLAGTMISSDPLTDGSPRRRLDRAARNAAVLVAGLALLAFANSFEGDFVFDDIQEIESNPALHRLWPPWEILTRSNAPARPLPYLSFAFDRSLWGTSPFGYHVTNLAIHIAGALALFGLARLTLSSPRLAGRFGPHAVQLAAVIAAIWAVHPLQTQAVTYVYQRIESMAGMFCLVSLFCFASAAFGGWSRPWLAGCVAAAAGAMASKETAVVLPLLIVSYDLFFVADSPRDIRGRWRLYAALAATWLILGLHLLLERAKYQELQERTHSPLAYAATQPGVILHYLRLAFWPVGQSLDYDWPIARSPAAILPPLAAILLLLAATAFGSRRRQPWAWLGLAFFLALAPTSSIMPVEAAANEHRMYLPLAAVVAGVVLGAATLLAGREEAGGSGMDDAGTDDDQRRLAWPWIGGLIAAAVIGSLIVQSQRRNALYADREAIWDDVLSHDPTNHRAHCSFAGIHDERGDMEKAIEHAELAVRKRPDSDIFGRAAATHLMAGDAAGAERLLRKGVELQSQLLAPDSRGLLLARAGLAAALYEQRKFPEAEAICAEIADPLERMLGRGHRAAIGARTVLANAAERRGDHAAAERIARENLADSTATLGPGDPASQQAAVPLAAALYKSGRPDDEDLLDRGRASAWPARPDLTIVRRTLAGMLEQSSRFEEAAVLREAIYDDCRRNLDENDPATVRAAVQLAGNLAAAAERRGDFPRAERISEENLTTAIRSLGLADPLTQSAAVSLATAVGRSGRTDEAEKILREFLDEARLADPRPPAAGMAEGSGPTDGPPAAAATAAATRIDTTLVLQTLAGLLETNGRLDEAVPIRRRILRDALERSGPDSEAAQRAAQILQAVIAARARDRKDGGGQERDGKAGAPQEPAIPPASSPAGAD